MHSTPAGGVGREEHPSARTAYEVGALLLWRAVQNTKSRGNIDGRVPWVKIRLELPKKVILSYSAAFESFKQRLEKGRSRTAGNGGTGSQESSQG